MTATQKKFKARIYKTGINWAVDVPPQVIKNMKPERGYVNVEGVINGFRFSKNLVPVKNGPYRLFVDGLMMKGAQTAIGKLAVFSIRQIKPNTDKDYPMPSVLQQYLKRYKVTERFEKLTPSRRKEILRYLSFIKTEETMLKNVEKVITQLRNSEKKVTVP